MKRSNPKQQQALQLLRGGYSVIPVRNKRSLFQWKEFQEHRPTEAQVEAWWVEYPDADIAVICGKVSGGLTVIDIDNLEIAKRFKGKEFIKRTRVVETPSGGLHLYFWDTSPNPKTRPLPDIGELRAEGAYVVCPPSSSYRFLSDVVPLRTNKVSEIADWLVTLVSGKKVVSSPTVASFSAGGKILSGTRQITLTSIAGSLRNRGLDQKSIEGALLVINRNACNPPIEPAEVASISRSMMRYPSGEFDSGIHKNVCMPKWISAKDLAEQESAEFDWLWYGYLPLGYIVLLSGLPKVGKTTLLTYLLRALINGTDFLSLPTGFTGDKKKILILTEENPAFLQRRFLGHGLNKEEILIIQRFQVSDWEETISQISLAAEKENIALLIMDTLPAFWGVRDENTAPDVLNAIQRLHKIVLQHGFAALLLHHLRKNPGEEGNAHRGSGALLGAVDIALELRRMQQHKNQRKIVSNSRFAETPQEHVIELSEDGQGYVSLGDAGQAEFSEVKNEVLALLPETPPGRTKEEIMDSLFVSKPSDTQLKNVLRDCCEKKLIEKTGTGHKGDPYRYHAYKNSIRASSSL